MKYQWRVEFKKVRESRLLRGIDKVTETTEVVVYAGTSEDAIALASRVGGVATKTNVCCVARLA